jgi:membrane protease YdiL (CAAX protease family)
MQAQAGELTASGPIRVPWTVKDALAGVATVAAATLVTIALVLLAGGGGVSELNPLVATLAFAGLPGTMVLAVWLFGVRRYRSSWRTLGFIRSRTRMSLLLPWLALLSSLAFGGLYVAIVTVAQIDFLLPPAPPRGILGEGLHRTVNVVIIALAGPLAEEVFFRGFLLAALVKPLGASRAAALGSAIFAANHGNPSVMAPVFVSGLLLSWLYLKTRSIWPPFTAHAAQNIIALSLAA